MKKETKKILNDLYKLDKGLKKYENDLVKIIQELIASKPDTGFSNNFKENLKAEIMKRVEEIKSSQPQKTPAPSFLNKFSYSLLGALVVIVLAVPVVYLNNYSSVDIFNVDELDTTPSLKQLSDNAFGQITVSGESNTANIPQGLGGGGSFLGNVEGMPSMIAPSPYSYKFSYVGEEFSIDESEMDVLKRYVSSDIQTKLANTLKGINLGFINISSLSNAKVQNLNIVEEREGGYSVAMGLSEETASINLYNDQVYTKTDQRNISIADIPADEEIIKISNSLLERFGVNLENYGQPVVDHSWRVYYDQRPVGDSAGYVPDTLQVAYPIVINGMTVYNEGGNVSGPQVSVNIRNNKANGAWGISSQNYQSSKYAVEQDTNKILDVALRGGYRRYHSLDSNGEVVNVEIGTPKFSFAIIYNFKDGKHEELFVPALAFPVVGNNDGGKFHQKNIIVPLVLDLLNQEDGGGLVPMPLRAEEPMLMTEPSA